MVDEKRGIESMTRLHAGMNVRLLCSAIIALALPVSGCSDKGDDPQPCHLEKMIGWDADPSWMPDGSGFIFFGSDTINRQWRFGLCRFNIADSSTTVLMDSVVTYTPKISPDGKWLVFEFGADIYIMTMDGDSIEQLTFLGKCFYPDWSPDGTKIAYDVSRGDDRGIYVLYLETRSSKQIISYCRQPVWFPDGYRLLVLDESGLSTGQIQISVIDTTGERLLQLTHDSTHAYKHEIDVSPTGDRIAFVQQFECEMPQLWIMNINGTGKKRLTSRGAHCCAFSPDGSWILYTYLGDDNGRIWAVKPDGTDKHQMTYRRGW
jgi:Tol biopolymer transport system component